MRIERQGEHRILCGHMLHVSQIKAGQRWISSGNHVVTVTDVKDNWVTYTWIERGTHGIHQKDAFGFQCRYGLILEDDQGLKDFEA